MKRARRPLREPPTARPAVAAGPASKTRASAADRIEGLYADGTPGEIFVCMAKEGSVIAGLMDSFATAVSRALQHGVPVQILVDKFKGTRFEPSCFTGNQEIPIATSIMDYISRWLSIRFPADGNAVDRHPAAREAHLPRVPLMAKDGVAAALAKVTAVAGAIVQGPA